ADVRAVDVGIGHDDDLVIAQLLEIERAFTFAVTDACADGGDHGADFVVLKNFVEARFFDVNQFAADGQNRLEFAVAALLGGATGRVTFDDVEFGVFWIAIRAIGEFSGQTAASERALANGFAGFARGFTSAGSIETLINNALRHGRIRIEI